MLDWISGLTSALRNAGEVIYGEYLAWLYRTVFGAIAEFFTQMSGMGTELFVLGQGGAGIFPPVRMGTVHGRHRGCGFRFCH